METQRVFVKGKFEKHIMCFLDFSFRNTFCVSMGKTLWKSQNMSLNGFFQGKHHPAPAVDALTLNGKEWSGSQLHRCDKQHQGASGKNPPLVPVHEHYPKVPRNCAQHRNPPT